MSRPYADERLVDKFFNLAPPSSSLQKLAWNKGFYFNSDVVGVVADFVGENKICWGCQAEITLEKLTDITDNLFPKTGRWSFFKHAGAPVESPLTNTIKTGEFFYKNPSLAENFDRRKIKIRNVVDVLQKSGFNLSADNGYPLWDLPTPGKPYLLSLDREIFCPFRECGNVDSYVNVLEKERGHGPTITFHPYWRGSPGQSYIRRTSEGHPKDVGLQPVSG